MTYIPKREFEDKPDVFSPFVPMDHENIVEVCEQQLNDTSKKLKPNTFILYILIALLVYFSLKRYKCL